MQVDVQVYKVQALPLSKTTPTAPVVNVVNNCDGTYYVNSINTQELYYGVLVNQLLQ
jgi:hypothetical protein